MIMIICSVACSMYALLLAGFAITGRIKRAGILCAVMSVIIVAVALLTKRVAAFALILFPAALTILLCLPERHVSGRRNAELPQEQEVRKENKILDRSEASRE